MMTIWLKILENSLVIANMIYQIKMVILVIFLITLMSGLIFIGENAQRDYSELTSKGKKIYEKCIIHGNSGNGCIYEICKIPGNCKKRTK